MQLMRLASDLRTEEMIGGYSSLIWTTRYDSPGEFQLTTSRVDETMAAMPLDSFVCLHDGVEMMMVESYSIDGDVLTVSGRDFTAFMENRIALDNALDYEEVTHYYPESGQSDIAVHTWLLQPNGAWNDSDAVQYMIHQHFVVGILSHTNLQNPPTTYYPEIVPNFSVVNLDTTNRYSPYTKFIERTDLLTAVMALLKNRGSGIRSFRPIGSLSGMQYQVYKGLDRTANQVGSNNDRVIFDSSNGDLAKERYVQSIAAHKNSFRVFPKSLPVVINRVTNEPNRKGLKFRDKLIDATEITTSFNNSDDRELAQIAALQRLNTEKAAALPVNSMDLEISPNAIAKFKTNYDLGDIVMVRGKYMTQNMRVAEYTRIEDETGERGYPGLKGIG